MSDFTIAHHNIPDWYVGEVYNYISEKFIQKYKNISFNHMRLVDLCDEYRVQMEFGCPSVFNIYNLLIINNKNKKTFVNSLYDHSIHNFTSSNNNIHLFDIKVAGIVSDAFNRPEYKHAIDFFNIKPSFYIHENYSDLLHIDKLFNSRVDKVSRGYFNGVLHSYREKMRDMLRNYTKVVIEDRGVHYRSKEDYYSRMASHIISLGLNGAANGGICYRDIEALGLGNLLVRENLGSVMYNPLLPNRHYIEFFSKEEQNIFYHEWDTFSLNTIEKLVIDRIEECFSNYEKYRYMCNEGREWYISNCLPDRQFDIIDSLTQNLEILF